MESHEGATKSSQINRDSSELADNRGSLGNSSTLDRVHGDAQFKLAGNIVHMTMALTNSADKPDTMLPQGLARNTHCAQGVNDNGQIWRKAKKQLVSAYFTLIKKKSIEVSVSSLTLNTREKADTGIVTFLFSSPG